MSRQEKLNWRRWTPGLDDDDRLVRQVYDTLPGAIATEIPWIVRLLENPHSRWSFPGAITLEDHDVVHILLGRGLDPHDEAFVIGFTMGHDPRSFRFGNLYAKLIKTTFLFLARHFYPKVYRWDRDEELVFKRAFWEGRKAYAFMQTTRQKNDTQHSRRAPWMNHVGTLCNSHLHDIAFRSPETIRAMREAFGISKERLRTVYRKEALLFPDDPIARRQDVCARTTMYRTDPLKGPKSDWVKVKD